MEGKQRIKMEIIVRMHSDDPLEYNSSGEITEPICDLVKLGDNLWCAVDRHINEEHIEAVTDMARILSDNNIGNL